MTFLCPHTLVLSSHDQRLLVYFLNVTRQHDVFMILTETFLRQLALTSTVYYSNSGLRISNSRRGQFGIFDHATHKAVIFKNVLERWCYTRLLETLVLLQIKQIVQH